MHDNPLTAAGSREPATRPQPIPAKVRAAIKLMVYGRMDDPDCTPLDFIVAARESGIRPDQMRRYLDRPQIRSLLLAERRAFRTAICASNEATLLDVRNNAANSMARIAAVRALEQLEETDTGAKTTSAPGITIKIIQGPASPPPTVDVTPPMDQRPVEQPNDPVFRITR
jgi:hypothetical protein